MVIIAVASLVFVAFILTMPACSAGTKTTVNPAATDATHGTRIERPGRTKTRTFELEIEPANAEPAPAEQANPGVGFGSPVGSLVAFTPIGGSPLGVYPAVENATSQPALQTVGWGKRDRATTQGAVTHRSQDINPAIADAIAEAARNGNSISLKITDTEEIPLTADVSESTLSDTGAGLDTHSDEAAINFDGSKTGSGLPYGGKSGKTKWGLDASLFSKSVNAMHIMGAIVMLGAIVPLWAPPRRWTAAGIIMGIGLLIIAAGTVSEQAPWVFVLAILGFLGLAGWLGYESWRNKRRGIALESIGRGVESAGLRSVKDQIGEAAGSQLRTVKSEVTATKNKAQVIRA
jgi:hypothetical protein